MTTLKEILPLLQEFSEEEKGKILSQTEQYDGLLAKLPTAAELGGAEEKIEAGILALNGASGAGQSYVIKRVEKLLSEKSLTLPRIYLLGTRSPRPDEGHKNPYIFAQEVTDGFQDIHNLDFFYPHTEIYYRYQSRPGADNAILLADVQAARKKIMYLETVIPTLLYLRENEISGIPPWRDKLKIVYLAAPSGNEWVFRLLNREPERLGEEKYRGTLLGRFSSSLEDMQLAAEHKITCVLNHYGLAEQAAQEILAAWGI
ncbi:MAG: hypothetical protein HQ525_11630 [Anaerolineae bacterium]|nr:hypothetical protein [Anaerolineae bacterium]